MNDRAFTGDYGRLHPWSSHDDYGSYKETDLAATIASAYKTAGAPDVRVFETLMPVRSQLDDPGLD